MTGEIAMDGIAFLIVCFVRILLDEWGVWKMKDED